MNGKSMLILVLLAAALAGVWFLTQDTDYTNRSSSPAALDVFAKINSSEVTGVTISKGGVSVRLVKNDSGWVVDDRWQYPASAEGLDRLLDTVRRISRPEIRAENKSSHALFDLDDATGTTVTLEGSGAPLPVSLTVGKSSGGGQGLPQRCFIRVGGGDTVYEVSPNLLFDAGLYSGREKPDSWLDKKIFAATEGSEVESVTMTIGAASIVVEAKPSVKRESSDPSDSAGPPPTPDREYLVTAPSEFEPDSTTVKSLVGRFRNVWATDFVDPDTAAAAGLSAPDRTVQVEFSDERTLVLEFGGLVSEEGDAPKYYGRIKGDRRVFTVGGHIRDGMFKSIEELTPKPPAAPESGSIGDEPEAIKPAGG